jgi:hypothetical protein
LDNRSDRDLFGPEPREFDDMSVTPDSKAATLPSAVAMVGAGAEAKAASPSIGGEMEAKEAAGKKKMARCDPIFVKQLIEKKKLYPRRPFQLVPDELLSNGGDEVQKLLEIQNRCAASLKEKWDWEDDIINQYYTKGHAEYLVDEEEGSSVLCRL